MLRLGWMGSNFSEYVPEGVKERMISWSQSASGMSPATGTGELSWYFCMEHDHRHKSNLLYFLKLWWPDVTVVNHNAKIWYQLYFVPVCAGFILHGIVNYAWHNYRWRRNSYFCWYPTLVPPSSLASGPVLESFKKQKLQHAYVKLMSRYDKHWTHFHTGKNFVERWCP